MLVLLSCAGSPAAPPPWAGNVRAVYPTETYITGLGEGVSRQDAENKALAEIAFYFVREITAERSSRSLWTERDGVSSAESRTEENVLVESQTRLVAVRYAENPWYNPAKKAWETVAFIERNEGWAVYEPAAKKGAEALLALVKAAEGETEPFNTVLRYIAAAAYAGSAGFNAVRDFAQILHPRAANALFAEADAALGQIPGKQLRAREKAKIFIDCPADYDRLVYQAMVKALGVEGFAVEENRAAAAEVCVLRVEEGERKTDLGIFYTPALIGTISGKGGALFSFRIQAARQSAVSPEVAKRRAYTALAAALESGFPAELSRAGNALVSK